jgi:hypothetical protein
MISSGRPTLLSDGSSVHVFWCSPGYLVLAAAANFGLLLLIYGTHVPGGLFLPSILIGTLWGEAFGILVHNHLVDSIQASSLVPLLLLWSVLMCCCMNRQSWALSQFSMAFSDRLFLSQSLLLKEPVGWCGRLRARHSSAAGCAGRAAAPNHHCSWSLSCCW